MLRVFLRLFFGSFPGTLHGAHPAPYPAFFFSCFEGPAFGASVAGRADRKHTFLLSGYPTGKTGDRGDRTELYVRKFYVPFLRPTIGPQLAQGMLMYLLLTSRQLMSCMHAQ